MSGRSWLIYGAYGFTGDLCAREALRRGARPVLAGRRREPVAALAAELGLPHRAFDLGDPEAVARGLEGMAAVLHCAGPFVNTSRPMVKACLATGTHYLDITGEMGVFESVQRRGDRAREAGVVLLPGVGFDVVPSDCLAARLARALPDATHLELAFAGDGAEWSRGTLKTMIESLPHAGAVRRDGAIVEVPMAWETREIDFPHVGRRLAVTIPWGDVSTAFYTTGIPNIRVYAATPPAAVRRMRRLRPFLPLVSLKPVKRGIQAWIGRTVTGPSAEVREHARIHLWGEARDAAGTTVTATLTTPEGYRLTALAAVEATLRVAAGQVEPGAWTPAVAFGADFVDTFEDVVSSPVATGAP